MRRFDNPDEIGHSLKEFSFEDTTVSPNKLTTPLEQLKSDFAELKIGSPLNSGFFLPDQIPQSPNVPRMTNGVVDVAPA